MEGKTDTVDTMTAQVNDGRYDDDAIWPLHMVNFGEHNGIQVNMEAFSPFDNKDYDNMAMPYAFYEVTLKNNNNSEADASIALLWDVSSGKGSSSTLENVDGKGFKSDKWAVYAKADGATITSGSDNGFMSTGECNNSPSANDDKLKELWPHMKRAGERIFKQVELYGGLLLHTQRQNQYEALQKDAYNRQFKNRNKVFNQQLGINPTVTVANYAATDISGKQQYISTPSIWRNYSQIELRLGSVGGKIIQTLEIPNTNGAWQTVRYELAEVIKGTNNVVFTFRSTTGQDSNLVDIDSFTFEYKYRLSSAKWTADASKNEKDVANAFDGDLSNRWTSGPQAGEEWFLLDLGEECEFNRIVLNNPNNKGDYPRRYEVLICCRHVYKPYDQLYR